MVSVSLMMEKKAVESFRTKVMLEITDYNIDHINSVLNFKTSFAFFVNCECLSMLLYFPNQAEIP